MKNILKVENHTAVISYDPEIDMLRGEFINLNGGADFYASSLEQLKKEAAISLAIFLDECRKDGIAPYKSYSGKISTRLSSENHQALIEVAQATGNSINDLLIEGAEWVLAKYAPKPVR